MRFKLRQNLDALNLGSPDQRIPEAPSTDQMALVERGHVGLKTTLLLTPGRHPELGRPPCSRQDNPLCSCSVNPACSQGMMRAMPLAHVFVPIIDAPRTHARWLAICEA